MSLGHRLACDVSGNVRHNPSMKTKKLQGINGVFLRRLHDNKNKDKILSLDTESFYYATNYKGRNKN